MIFPISAIPPLVTIFPSSQESLGSEYSGNPPTWVSSTYPTANKAIYIPFLVFQPLVFSYLFCMNGSAVSGNLDLGIYDASGTRIVSTGSTAQTGTNTSQVITVTATELAPGQFYLAIAMDNTTGTLFKTATGDINSEKVMGMANQTTAFVLPATATMATISSDYIPLIGLSTRSVI